MGEGARSTDGADLDAGILLPSLAAALFLALLLISVVLGP